MTIAALSQHILPFAFGYGAEYLLVPRDYEKKKKNGSTIIRRSQELSGATRSVHAAGNQSGWSALHILYCGSGDLGSDLLDVTMGKEAVAARK
jgi:hypothetical protein